MNSSVGKMFFSASLDMKNTVRAMTWCPRFGWDRVSALPGAVL